MNCRAQQGPAGRKKMLIKKIECCIYPWPPPLMPNSDEDWAGGVREDSACNVFHKSGSKFKFNTVFRVCSTTFFVVSGTGLDTLASSTLTPTRLRPPKPDRRCVLSHRENLSASSPLLVRACTSAPLLRPYGVLCPHCAGWCGLLCKNGDPRW